MKASGLPIIESIQHRRLCIQIEQGVVFQSFELKIDTLQSLKLNESLVNALIAEIATEEVITAVVFRSAWAFISTCAWAWTCRLLEFQVRAGLLNPGN